LKAPVPAAHILVSSLHQAQFKRARSARPMKRRREVMFEASSLSDLVS